MSERLCVETRLRRHAEELHGDGHFVPGVIWHAAELLADLHVLDAWLSRDSERSVELIGPAPQHDRSCWTLILRDPENGDRVDYDEPTADEARRAAAAALLATDPTLGS